MALKLCRCLCVLLLSIVNKDLLFVIIESYDWRVAHEAEQHRYVVVQITKKKLTWFSWCNFLLQSTSTDSDPLAAGGPWVDRWDSLWSLWWSAVVCVCVFRVRDVWSQSTLLAGLRLFYMWYLSCLCVSILSYLCLASRLSEVFHRTVQKEHSET